MKIRENPWQTEVSRTQPLLVRLFFPSVADLIFIILLASFSFTALSTRLLNDAGIGWHIRTGQQILATHMIPRTDSFSSTMSGKPWYAWEWLFDVIVAAIHNRAALNGVVLFTAAVIAATFALTFRIAMMRGAGLPIAVVLVVLAASASTIHFFARPHIFTWLFTVIWFQLLDSAERSHEKAQRLYWFPSITVLWANLHGGFLLGFVLLGIYIVAGAIRYLGERCEPGARTRTAAWLKTLGIVSALSLAASFVNPYGYKLHAHIYGYLSDRFLMNHIDEFQSPNFHGIAQRCFAALLLITLVAVASARPKRMSHLLVLIFAVYSGLYASRNLPTSSILLVLIVGPMLSFAIHDAIADSQISQPLRRFFTRLNSFDWRMGNMEFSLAGHIWPAAVVVIGAIAAVNQGRLGCQQLINAHFGSKRFPVHAVDYISQQNIHEPIFAPDFWGGYLIYRLYPETKVTVDDRHDLYGDQFLKDYLKVIHVEPGWDRVLDSLHVQWVLAEADSPLANILRAAHWEVKYQDDRAVLFERMPSAAGF